MSKSKALSIKKKRKEEKKQTDAPVQTILMSGCNLFHLFPEALANSPIASSDKQFALSLPELLDFASRNRKQMLMTLDEELQRAREVPLYKLTDVYRRFNRLADRSLTTLNDGQRDEVIHLLEATWDKWVESHTT